MFSLHGTYIFPEAVAECLSVAAVAHPHVNPVIKQADTVRSDRVRPQIWRQCFLLN